MSFKTITRIAVGSAILGTAVLAPSVAQAKAAPELSGPQTLVSCASATADPATGSVTGTSFTVSLPASAPAGAYEVRARVFTLDASGKQVFSTKKARVPVTDTVTSSVGSLQHIWRLDVSNLTAEAAGLPALAYTSAGAIGCD